MIDFSSAKSSPKHLFSCVQRLPHCAQIQQFSESCIGSSWSKCISVSMIDIPRNLQRTLVSILRDPIKIPNHFFTGASCDIRLSNEMLRGNISPKVTEISMLQGPNSIQVITQSCYSWSGSGWYSERPLTKFYARKISARLVEIFIKSMGASYFCPLV